MTRCRSCGTAWETEEEAWETEEEACPECGSRNVDEDYAPSPLEEQFRAEVLKCLEPAAEALAKGLRAVLRRKLDEDTYLIDFEVHSHGYPGYERQDFRFTLRWDAMDEEAGQLEDGGALLRGKGVTIPKEVYWAPENEAFDPNDAAFRVLVRWFAGCWKQAGGHGCRYPAYLCHHDSSVSFDLKAGRWVRNNTKWAEDA